MGGRVADPDALNVSLLRDQLLFTAVFVFPQMLVGQEEHVISMLLLYKLVDRALNNVKVLFHN